VAGNGLAALALLAAHAAHAFQIALELIDAPLDATAVGSSWSRPVRGYRCAPVATWIAAPSPRQHVFKLRQFHLQLSLAGARVRAKMSR